MRNYYLLFALLFTTSGLQAQTPSYFSNSPTWYYYYEGGGGSGGTSYYSWAALIYVDGDSTFNGHQYTRLRSRGYDTNNGTTMPGYFNYLYGYFRQENDAIYKYDFLNQQDSLMISYSGQVGDTLQSCQNFNAYNNFSASERIIEKIDSLYVGSEYRKVIYLDTINGPMIIEGVANVSFFASIEGATIPLEGYEPIGIESLCGVCYGLSNQQFYSSGVECHFYIGLEENPWQENVVVVHDPLAHVVRVSSDKSISELRLYDALGTLIGVSTTSEVDVLGIAPGVYHAILRFGSESISRRLVVFE